jgi:hypothetical protein
MKVKARFLIILLILSLQAFACRIPNFAGAQPVSITMEASTSTPKALFWDDFSDPSSGWDRFTSEDGTNDYSNGGYRIFVNKPNWYFWSNPGIYFTDVVIDVDAQKMAGPDENDFGIICRYQDEQNFYFFTVGSDGFYGISKILNGEELLIGMSQLQYSDSAIQPGSSSNHLTAECVGSNLTLSVNGVVLADVEDRDLSTGDVGLIAGTYDTVGVDILFDNFVVTRP